MLIILQHKLHELWEKYRLDRPLVNIIIRFLDLPVRVFRQLELNPRYDPRQPGGVERQTTEFPLASHYYREGYHYLRITNSNHLSLHRQRLEVVRTLSSTEGGWRSSSKVVARTLST